MPDHVQECPARYTYKWRTRPGLLRVAREGLIDVCMVQMLARNASLSMRDVRVGPNRCNGCLLCKHLIKTPSPEMIAEFEEMKEGTSRWMQELASTIDGLNSGYNVRDVY